MHPASPPVRQETGQHLVCLLLRARARNSWLSASAPRKSSCMLSTATFSSAVAATEAPPAIAPRLGVSSLPIHSFDSSVTTASSRKRRRHGTMASATATATMAAAGFDKRASSASSLQTPGSGSFPSELMSPMTGSPGFAKKEDALKTPITPPSAYLDFLKNFSPAVQSPASTGTSARFSFHEGSFEKPSDQTQGPKSASISPPTSQPASQPALSRNTSYESDKSSATERSDASTESIERSKPQSPRIIIPPSQFARPTAPRSARTPRRLHIPQSPLSSALSTHSVPSPYSSTPVSAAPWSASFSPRDFTMAEANAGGPPGKVHVRQVVTRTVTYCRTPLEPAPKGKRRKIEVEEAEEVATNESTSSKDETEETAIKQELNEKMEESDSLTVESKKEDA